MVPAMDIDYELCFTQCPIEAATFMNIYTVTLLALRAHLSSLLGGILWVADVFSAWRLSTLLPLCCLLSVLMLWLDEFATVSWQNCID